MAYRYGDTYHPNALRGIHYDRDRCVIAYTDGCCINNGQYNAYCGIGGFFGDGCELNFSEPLSTHFRQTNNNAEIMAAKRACEQVKRAHATGICICTDSTFLIQCVTEWMHRWERNGWRTSDNRPVENKEALLQLKNAMKGLRVNWEHVPGHSKDYGNDRADELARAGAQQNSLNPYKY